MRGGRPVADSSTGPIRQERERILQSAGEEQQHRKLGDVEGEQPGRAVGLEPLRHRKAHAQRHVEPGRQRDHRQAGPDRQLVVEPDIDHQHGGGLADHREPAQPHQRVEAHAASVRRMSRVAWSVMAAMYAFVQPAQLCPIDRDNAAHCRGAYEAPSIGRASSGTGLAHGRAARHMCGCHCDPTEPIVPVQSPPSPSTSW